MKNHFEYDPHKSQRNKERHGIDFEQAQALWDTSYIFTSAKDVRGEQRSFIVARLEEHLYVAVFTNRQKFIRIISCHRADNRFERLFMEAYREK